MIYPTINEAVNNHLTMRLGSRASVLTPLLSSQLKPRLGIDAQVLRSVDKVKDTTAPKLFIVGAEDQHTTPGESFRLFNAAREPKQFCAISGAQRIDLHQFAKDQ